MCVWCVCLLYVCNTYVAVFVCVVCVFCVCLCGVCGVCFYLCLWFFVCDLYVYV